MIYQVKINRHAYKIEASNPLEALKFFYDLKEWPQGEDKIKAHIEIDFFCHSAVKREEGRIKYK